MATQKYSVKKVVTAVTEGRGLVTVIAQRLGCTPETVRNYARRYPEVQEALETQRDRLVDSAEMKLTEAIETRGEPWAVALVLKTLGKKRGYVERLEQSGPDGGPIEHAHALDLSGASDEELDILERLAIRAVPGHPESAGSA